MSKFKVGDRVYDNTPQTNRAKGKISATKNDKVKVDWDSASTGTNGSWWPEADFTLIEGGTKSPIRTVTRKEIVPGDYGDVIIDDAGNGIAVVAGFRGDTLKPYNLREAAHMLNQIAEALDET